MTLEEIENIDSEFLDIATVSEYLNIPPQYIMQSIRRGVPWGYALGNGNFRIPKRAFVNCHKHGVDYGRPRAAGPGDYPALPRQAGSLNVESAGGRQLSGQGRQQSFDMQEVISRITDLGKQMNLIINFMDNAKRFLK
jgi:hypothetical protein